MVFGGRYPTLTLLQRRLSRAKTSQVKPGRSSRIEGRVAMTRMGKLFVYLNFLELPPVLMLSASRNLCVFLLIYLQLFMFD
jgi:hypothetical protein